MGNKNRRVIPSPRQAEPYPGTPEAARARLLGLRADPCRPGEAGVATRVPDRGDDAPRRYRPKLRYELLLIIVAIALGIIGAVVKRLLFLMIIAAGVHVGGFLFLGSPRARARTPPDRV